MSQKKKIRRLHHIGAPAGPPARRVAPPYRCTHTHACTPLSHPRTLSAQPSPLVVFLFPSLLFLVLSFSSSSSVCRARPPPPRSKVICAMDAAELYYLNGRPFSPNSILPGRSSPVRLRLTACGRPVGLPTTLTQCQRQLRSLSFHCYLYVTVIKGLLLRQRSGLSQLDSPAATPFQCPSFPLLLSLSALLVTVPQGSRLVVLRCWALCWGCSTWLLGGPLGCSVPWLPALPLVWLWAFAVLADASTAIAFVSHRLLRVSHYKSQH